MNNSGVS